MYKCTKSDSELFFFFYNFKENIFISKKGNKKSLFFQLKIDFYWNLKL